MTGDFADSTGGLVGDGAGISDSRYARKDHAMQAIRHLPNHNRSRPACRNGRRTGAVLTGLPLIVAALLLSIGPRALADPAAHGGSVPTATSPPALTIAGTISFTATYKYSSTNFTETSTEKGTFSIDVTAASNPPLPDGIHSDGSSYQFASSGKAVNLASSSCPETTAWHANVSGPLTDTAASGSGVLVSNYGPPYAKYAGFDITFRGNVTTKQSSCDGSSTQTQSLPFEPMCRTPYSRFGDLPGKVTTAADGGGSINMKCSGHSGGLTVKVSGTLAVTSPCTAPFELSGADWVSKFQGSSSPDALDDPFKTDVTRFIKAMESAGIAVVPNSTYRPYERSYLMHYSWLIAKAGLSPKAVPPFEPPDGAKPVDICWIHYASDGTYDAQASLDAAWAMVGGYHTGGPKLKTAPALRSMHNVRLAIDMSIAWTRSSITIVNGSGHKVTINTTPRTGLNEQLMAVGATYDVIHFCYDKTCTKGNPPKTPSDDADHWSSDGH